jgi:HEAT repeat protein
MEYFRTYAWPGNTGELQRILKRLAILTPGPEATMTDLAGVAPEFGLAAPAREPAPPPRSALDIGRQRALDDALSEFGSDDAGQRHAAAGKLGRLAGERATEALKLGLNDPVPTVRQRIAEVLTGRPGVAAAAAERLEAETEPGVAAALLNIIAANGDAPSFDIVSRGLRSADAGVRKAAMRALRTSTIGRFEHSDAVLASQDREPSVRAEGLAALVTLGDQDAVDSLLELAKMGSPEDRSAACALLSELELGTTRLVDFLGTGDNAVRTAVIRSLGSSGIEAAVPSLIEAMREPHARTEAIRALGSIGALEAIDAIDSSATNSLA